MLINLKSVNKKCYHVMHCHVCVYIQYSVYCGFIFQLHEQTKNTVSLEKSFFLCLIKTIQHNSFSE